MLGGEGLVTYKRERKRWEAWEGTRQWNRQGKEDVLGAILPSWRQVSTRSSWQAVLSSPGHSQKGDDSDCSSVAPCLPPSHLTSQSFCLLGSASVLQTPMGDRLQVPSQTLVRGQVVAPESHGFMTVN
jgi:hypothetical protein